MRDLNMDFLELYKRTDRFIKDAYSSSDGVSEYLRIMDSCFNNGNLKVRGWKTDYESLKHARWIRNQLSHEVGFDSDICSSDDYEWLDEFYRRLFSADDPLAVLRKLSDQASATQRKQDVDNGILHYSGTINTPQQSLKQKPVKKQSSGCLTTFVMILVFSLSIILSILMFL
ncbi:MAG: hypothetical protein J6Y71_04425 [Ruminococcus sp.]|nr:hypothetical protein [Ruminococcus sp.]